MAVCFAAALCGIQSVFGCGDDLCNIDLLGGCGKEEVRRDVYKSREDCLADWGNKPEDCTPATEKLTKRASGVRP